MMNIPIEGTKLVRGPGTAITRVNNSKKQAIMRSNFGCKTPPSLGLMIISTRFMYGIDLLITICKVARFICFLAIKLGNFGASYFNIICAAIMICGNAKAVATSGIAFNMENSKINIPKPRSCSCNIMSLRLIISS